MVCSLSGCSLFVMGFKALLGDPTVPSTFKKMTHTDLAAEDKQVLVVSSTPHAIKSDFPSLDYDLAEGVSRRLKRHDIRVIKPDKVASWMDRNGGYLVRDDWPDLAGELGADYIVHVKLDRFRYRQPNSRELFRGRATGHVSVHEVVGDGEGTTGIFEREYRSKYPENYPVSSNEMSAKVFRKRYLDRVCDEIALMFYDHRISKEMY